MNKEKIYIKNMVCPRCITAVETIFHDLNIAAEKVILCEAIVDQIPGETQLLQLKNALVKNGFDIVEDKKDKIVEAVKTRVIQLIKYPETLKHAKLSAYLAEQIGYDYSHISSIFTATQGITIEKYVILQKIEYVKELLSYNELTLSEIAHQLNYSITAALSAQFKDVTGTTPSAFKKLREQGRKSLDNLIP